MTDNERERFITQLLDSVGTLVPSLDQPVFDDKRRVLKNAFFFPDNCSGALSNDLKNRHRTLSVFFRTLYDLRKVFGNGDTEALEDAFKWLLQIRCEKESLEAASQSFVPTQREIESELYICRVQLRCYNTFKKIASCVKVSNDGKFSVDSEALEKLLLGMGNECIQYPNSQIYDTRRAVFVHMFGDENAAIAIETLDQEMIRFCSRSVTDVNIQEYKERHDEQVMYPIVTTCTLVNAVSQRVTLVPVDVLRSHVLKRPGNETDSQFGLMHLRVNIMNFTRTSLRVEPSKTRRVVTSEYLTKCSFPTTYYSLQKEALSPTDIEAAVTELRADETTLFTNHTKLKYTEVNGAGVSGAIQTTSDRNKYINRHVHIDELRRVFRIEQDSTPTNRKADNIGIFNECSCGK